MQQMKVLIADDEIEARQLIYFFLKELEVSCLIKETGDGLSTIQALEGYEPDILFLDIKMPGLNGIEVLEQKDKSNLPAIIFTTASDEYALSAFDFDAVDYLLKPFEQERFQKALSKAMNFVDSLKPEKKFISTLTIKHGNRSVFLPVKDILYFGSDGNYVEVFIEDKKYSLNQALYKVEVMLDPGDFIRVHRSTIVNVHAVRNVTSLANGDSVLVLSNGQKVRASRFYKTQYKVALGLQ
jgi:two-component system, LytTR family, response regulator